MHLKKKESKSMEQIITEEFTPDDFPPTIDDLRTWVASMAGNTPIGNPMNGEQYHPYSQVMEWKYPGWKFDTSLYILKQDQRKQFSGEDHPIDLAVVTGYITIDKKRYESVYLLPDWLILLNEQMQAVVPYYAEEITASSLQLLLRKHPAIPHHNTGIGSWLKDTEAPFEIFNYDVMHGMPWQGAYLSSIKQAIQRVIDTGTNYPFTDHRVIRAWLEKFALRPYDVKRFPPEIFQEDIPGLPWIVVWPVFKYGG